MKNDYELAREFIDKKLAEIAAEQKLLEPKITMKIRFKKCHPAAVIPKRATTGAAGFDLTAVSENWKDGCVIYDTGIAVEIPAGYVGLLFQRSSVYKTGLSLCNAVGVCDADFRGSISFVFRIGYGPSQPYKKGERIGQIVFVPIPDVELVEASELSETERGTGGYGSTGK
jgi:dUTP pyrophosphatase